MNLWCSTACKEELSTCSNIEFIKYTKSDEDYRNIHKDIIKIIKVGRYGRSASGQM